MTCFHDDTPTLGTGQNWNDLNVNEVNRSEYLEALMKSADPSPSLKWNDHESLEKLCWWRTFSAWNLAIILCASWMGVLVGVTDLSGVWWGIAIYLGGLGIGIGLESEMLGMGILAILGGSGGAGGFLCVMTTCDLGKWLKWAFVETMGFDGITCRKSTM